MHPAFTRSPLPPGQPVSPVKRSPGTPMRNARPAPLAPCGSGWGRSASWCRVPGQEGGGKGRRKATVPGLTYQPEQRSPTRRGVRVTGGGGRAEGAGTGEGETDKNHSSLMRWTTSRSRGGRSGPGDPENQQERTQRSKPEQLRPGEGSACRGEGPAPRDWPAR